MFKLRDSTSCTEATKDWAWQKRLLRMVAAEIENPYQFWAAVKEGEVSRFASVMPVAIMFMKKPNVGLKSIFFKTA